jgi:hypothetical protein
MAVPILYLNTFPNSASADGDGAALAIFADDGSNQHQTILATVGGLLTFTLTSRGSAFTSGTYPNIPIVTTGAPAGPGQAGTVTVGVSATGQITVVTPSVPGYGYALQNFGFSAANMLVIGTPGSVIATIAIASVLPCSAPFPIGTKFIEMEVDANGPASVTIDSTLTSIGLTNGILTTLQATLTTVVNRIAANERLARRVSTVYVPVQGASGAGFSVPTSLQVIMGTAAA